jgi:hypothetical protein
MAVGRGAGEVRGLDHGKGLGIDLRRDVRSCV